MTTPVLGEWIQFDLGTAKVIQTYGLGNGGAEKEIGNWTLAGSTDNSTWYTIDTQTEPTPAHNSFDTYTTAGPAAAGSFRYIRLIVQGLRQQPYIMGSTLEFILYLQDSSGIFLQTSPSNTATFSENIGNTTGSFRLSTSASDTFPWNAVGAGPSQPGYYYGTNDTYTGTVSTSITSGAPGGGSSNPTASSFGNTSLSTFLSGPCQIILSANEQNYIIVSAYNGQIIQTNLDGTSTSVLFTLDTSLVPFDTSNYIVGITYNPSKTKFILVIAGTVSTFSTNNFVVEVNLDGTNPVVKMNDSTVFAGTSQQALRCPQCITLTADQQFYLITMYSGYEDGLRRIIKVPVNDMSNPTVFATNAMFDNSVSPEQLAYTPSGNFIFPGYDGNSIYTMDSDGTNVALLYTAADIGVSLPWGPIGMIQTADGTGYLISGYDSGDIKFLPMGSSPTPTAPPAPTSLSATTGNGSVSISFTQASDGGDTITNYKYSLDAGATFTALSPAATTSPVVIGGLTNGVSYNIQLKAVNSIGDGDASASITVTPPLTTPALGGLFIKVVLPSAIGLGSYEFNTPLPHNSVPDHIAIYGNTDGSNNVYLVNDQATASNTVIITSNNAAYSTYYIVVNSLSYGAYANLKYIRFYNPTGGAITPTTVTMSSGWNTLFLSNGGSISDPMFFFTNTSGGDYVYMNLSSYYNGSFNGAFNNALMVITAPIRGNYFSFTLSSAASIASYGLGTYAGSMTIYKWALLGSNDNTTWDLINQRTETNNNVYNTTVYTLSNPTTLYSYVRLVFQSYTNTNATDYFFYSGGFWLKRADGSFITSSSGVLSSEFTSPSFSTAQLATVTNTGSVGPNLDVGGGSAKTTTLLGLYNGTGFAYTGTVSSTISSGPLPPPPTTANVLGSWFQMDFGSGETMTSYGMLTDNPPYAPTSWTMTGSNDTVNWFQIDTRTGVSWTAYSQQNFAPTGGYSAMPYRYYRWIIRSLATAGSAYITPTRFYASDASGPIGWVGDQSVSISSDLVNQRSPNNWNMNTTGGGTNFFGTSSYPSGAYSGSISTTVIVPPSAPPAPTSLSASAGNESVSISFTQGSDGGSAITNYKYSLNGGSTFTAFSPAATTSPVVIGGLTNGVAYTIQLKAVSSIGDGDASASITVTPATIPDAPTNLIASYAGSGAVSISFTPGSNGGEIITNYQYSIDCGSTFTPLTPVDGITPITIEGLTNGVSYCIELKALNSIGAGIASSSVQYTVFGPAAAPTNMTWVDTLNGTISLDFTSGSDEGSAITNYEYSMDGGSTFTAFSPAQTTSPVSITGLNIRTHYSIVLRAVNEAGAGVSSATLNMYYMCFLEGTKILCFNPETNQEEYRAIETLRKGSLVKTVDDGYKAIDMIGTSKIYNPGNSVRSKNRLYKCSKENYPSLTEDLFITGCHSILVKDISEAERAELMEFQGKIYITDNHYRLIAAVDKRAEPHACEGVFNIWHMALENENYYFNYGIYANGLLVETSSLRMMKELSGMDLVQ